MNAFVDDFARTVAVDADQVTERVVFAGWIIEPGACEETALGIGDAVVHVAALSVDFRGNQLQRAGSVPQPDSSAVDYYPAFRFVERRAADLEVLFENRTLAGLPVVRIERPRS